MEPLSFLLLFGLEIHRFAPTDDGAEGLGSTLEAVEAGGHRLGPYEGPALRPYLALERGPVGFELAPALAGRIQRLESAEGREATLITRRWLLEARARYGNRVYCGVDAAVSGGRATLAGESVAEAGTSWSLGPMLGLRASISPGLSVVGRARYLWTLADDAQTDGLGGSVGLEWRLGGTREN
jgi:hypothetical protein